MRARGKRFGTIWPMAGLLGALLLAGPAAAQQAGSVRIERPVGYGRLVFRFDEPVEAKARVSGSVLILAFDRPVKLNTDRLPIELSAYVAGVRADPDRKSLRIALTQAVRADLKDAAEELYLDLLPVSWRGAAPPLPPQVVSDLARRAREAREAVKQAEARPPRPPAPALHALVAAAPDRTRIAFDLPEGVTAALARDGSTAELRFSGSLTLDEAKIRAALSSHVSGVRFAAGATGPALIWQMPEGLEAREGRDGSSIFVDLVRPPAPAKAEAAPQTPAQEPARAAAPPPPVAPAPPPVLVPDIEQLKLAVAARPPYPWMEPTRWAEDRRGSLRDGERALIAAAADAPKRERSAARLRIIGFYLANGFSSEALGVLKVAIADDAPLALRPETLLMRALAHILADNDAGAGQALFHPALATDPEAALWRAYLFSRAQKHRDALPGFQANLAIVERSPETLQVRLRAAIIETALAENDLTLAANQLGDLEQLDPALRPVGLVDLYQGRLAEHEGRGQSALLAYQAAAKSPARPVEIEARLAAALVARRLGAADAERTIAELETIAMIWRRDGVEVRARAALAELFVAASKWRDAFAQSRRAVEILPDHPVTRSLQDDMGRQFEALFLEGKADTLPKVEALAIFDEFRALVPVGPRGDDIARKLAERLYDLDLIDQAAALLGYQVQNRLKGVPRAEASARLAVMHLAAGRPQEALATLRASRNPALPEELRRARVLLEARTLSELSRTDLALEVMAAEEGPDAETLRADIHWRAKVWQEAAESYERALGERWRAADPLDAAERGSLIRAGVGYILAADRIGLDRLRGKYLARMAGTPDEATFRLITIDHLSRPDAFRDVARSAVSAQTLGDFLEAYRKRFPAAGGAAKRPGPAGAG